MTAMTVEIAAQLREPFDPKHVGKLPRVTCRGCRDAQGKVCQQHQKVRCQHCGNYITSAHMHLDYVGHAEITDRLLHADPAWTWEPVALGPDGLPLLDRNGGLWIRLTVAGVTRLGYGHADGKTGPDAVKEAIGDALRNAAMRFGVALDLWGATFKDGQHDDDPESEPEQPRPARPARNIELANARAAIGRATSPQQWEAIGRVIAQRVDEGVFTQADADELGKEIIARADAIQADRTAESAVEQPAMGDDKDWPKPAVPGQGDPA